MGYFQVRELNAGDYSWVAGLLAEHWSATKVVSRGRVHDADRLPGFLAEADAERVGLVTYRLDSDECEVVTLNSLREGIGIGSALLDAVRGAAHKFGCRRTWLITTNDTLHALRFYQKRGWRLVALHRNALDESRRLKPVIPEIGIDDIPLRDEIELEFPS